MCAGYDPVSPPPGIKIFKSCNLNDSEPLTILNILYVNPAAVPSSAVALLRINLVPFPEEISEDLVVNVAS